MVVFQVGDMPNIADMDKDALAAVIKQLYDQSCAVFAEKENVIISLSWFYKKKIVSYITSKKANGKQFCFHN